MFPWLLCGALAAVALMLCIRLYLLQKALDEISAQLGERLSSDTNNPIFLSTRNPHAGRLAELLNLQLRELRRQRHRFENGDRELKEAVTNVSHDLRTPLTAICGYLELLERRCSGSDRESVSDRESASDRGAASDGESATATERYLALIGERVEAMKRLTDELLRYSVAAGREDDLTLEPVDLNGAVEEAAASFYGAFMERGVSPRISLPEERVVRRLDRTALSRVLGNLLSNALKYSGGDLDVTLTADGTITMSNAAPDLNEVTVGRLFDRFYTVETGRGSTGLGLSIARTLAERMGGRIDARYEAGRLWMALHFPAP